MLSEITYHSPTLSSQFHSNSLSISFEKVVTGLRSFVDDFDNISKVDKSWNWSWLCRRTHNFFVKFNSTFSSSKFDVKFRRENFQVGATFSPFWRVNQKKNKTKHDVRWKRLKWRLWLNHDFHWNCVDSSSIFSEILVNFRDSIRATATQIRQKTNKIK